MLLNKMLENFLKPTRNLIVLSIIIFALNFILILQLIPVFESQTFNSEIVNLFVFPPNFIFEDLLGITSIKSIDYLTWMFQFIYDYLIAGVIMKITGILKTK